VLWSSVQDACATISLVANTRTPSRRPDDGRRADLIAAASRVIARDGIAAATTRRIAEEAGVPSGLVHYWFSGKDELLEAVIADTLGTIETAVADSSARSDEAQDALLDRLRAALQVVQEDDRGRQIAMYEMTTWALRKPELAHVAQHQYQGYRRMAADAVTAWVASSNADLPADSEVVGQLLAALVDGLTLSWLADPDGTDIDGVLTLVSALIGQFAALPILAEQ